MIYIDATDHVMGRVASVAAKQLLNGERVYIVNAEKSVIIGKPETTVREYKEKRARGDPYHGPFFPSKPDRILKRTVRGMIPYKTARGKEAFKRLRVFISIPDELKGKEFTGVKGAENKGEEKYMTLGDVSGSL